MLVLGGSTAAIVVLVLLGVALAPVVVPWAVRAPGRALRWIVAWQDERALAFARRRAELARAEEAEQRAINEQLRSPRREPETWGEE